MLKLSRANEGNWIKIPGKFFESDNVELKLKILTQDKLLRMDRGDLKKNTVTGKLYTLPNTVKKVRAMNKLLFETCLGWKGIEEDFNEENFSTFLNSYGSIKVAKIKKKGVDIQIDEDEDDFEDLDENIKPEVDDSEMEDQTLYQWLMATVTDAAKVITKDLENLQTTS